MNNLSLALARRRFQFSTRFIRDEGSSVTIVSSQTGFGGGRMSMGGSDPVERVDAGDGERGEIIRGGNGGGVLDVRRGRSSK